MAKKVLIVEDGQQIQESCTDAMTTGEYDFITLPSLREAADMLDADHAVVAVIIDTNVSDGGLEEACALVRNLQAQDFKGPIVAASSSRSFCQELVDAGCTHTVDGEKYRIGDELMRALSEIQ